MSSPGPTLSDGVVRLRPLGWGDVEAHLAGQDDALARWLDGGHRCRESVEDYVRACRRQWWADGPTLVFGICAGEELVGTTELHLDEPGAPVGQADVTYGLYPHARGHGYATRAVRLAVGYLRERPGVARAVVRVDPGNPASAAVAARCGFGWSHRTPAFAGGFDCYRLDLHRLDPHRPDLARPDAPDLRDAPDLAVC